MKFEEQSPTIQSKLRAMQAHMSNVRRIGRNRKEEFQYIPVVIRDPRVCICCRLSAASYDCSETIRVTMK